MKIAFAAAAAFTSALAASGAALAQASVADFYRGKQIQLRIGSTPGGGYDIAGRLVAPYIAKHLPGSPSIIVQNVPGAGSLTLANQLYNVAPKDGTVIGVVTNGMPSAPLLTPDAAKFDTRKFGWIGAQAPETQIVLASDDSGLTKIDDLFTKELLTGALTLGTATVDVPLVTNAALGTKFKLVLGYASLAAVDLAMERGEVHGSAAAGWMSVKARKQDVLASGKVKIFFAQYGFKKHPDLPNVPLFDLSKVSEADRQAVVLMFARQEYGRPLIAPPGIPAERLTALRRAFDAAMTDPAFVKDAKRSDTEINPVSGEELEKLTEEIMKTPPAVVARVRALLDPGASKK